MLFVAQHMLIFNLPLKLWKCFNHERDHVDQEEVAYLVLNLIFINPIFTPKSTDLLSK